MDDAPQLHSVESVRSHGEVVLLKLVGCDDRESADALRGHWLQVPIDEAVPLNDGEVYLFQLLGLAVESESGEQLGTVTELIETGSNLVLSSPGRIANSCCLILIRLSWHSMWLPNT